jgi:hypothetical protein
VTLHDALVRHASLLCEQALARGNRPRAVHDASRTVTFAVARWLADSAAADAIVRRALEEIYLEDQPERASPPAPRLS